MKRFALLAFFVFMAGCQTIPPTVTKAFSDDHDSMLVEDLIYSIGESKVQIIVPKGFVTDYASIPKGLWSFGLSPHGKYSKAAIIHDYLYWSQGCTKSQADKLLLIAMKESGVSAAHQVAIYEGVTLGGGPSWKANQEAKSKGLPRVIPQSYWNFPGDVTWDGYRAFLYSKGVKDPSFMNDPPYCKFGDSAVVPTNG